MKTIIAIQGIGCLVGAIVFILEQAGVFSDTPMEFLRGMLISCLFLMSLNALADWFQLAELPPQKERAA